MATFYGGGSLTFGGSAVAGVQSAEVNIQQDTQNAQTLADRWAIPVGVNASWGGSAEVLMDTSATGQASLMNTLVTATPTRTAATCTIVLASATGGGTLTGSILITGWAPKTNTQDVVKATITFVGSGAPSIT